MATATVSHGVTIEQALREGTRPTVFRKNSIHASAWQNGRRHVFFRDGTHMIFQPSLASQSCRGAAEINGWDQRMNDCMAMSADEDTGRQNIEEKKARLRTLIAHYESGADSWELPRAASTVAGGLTETLVARAMVRAGKVADEAAAQAVFATLAAKRNEDPAAIWRMFAQDREVATAILDLRREDALARMPAQSVDADELLREAMGA